MSHYLSLKGRLEEDGDLVSLLPSYTPSKNLFISDTLPCHGAKIRYKDSSYILKEINREIWMEGLFLKKNDIPFVKRYKDKNQFYKINFDEKQFLLWIKSIEENTAICDMENKNVGKGVFVPPGKKLMKGTFIPSSGMIELNPSLTDLETKVHCSALQDFDSSHKTIYGLINPEKIGGIFDLINHAPDKEELANFEFKNTDTKKSVATANLFSTIKYFNGYAIMGAEAIYDIEGEEYGKQLLWSYARSDEYLGSPINIKNNPLLLFDHRNGHDGEIIDPRHYTLKEITIYVDSGDLFLNQIALLTRWEIIENSPESFLLIHNEESYDLDPIQSPITYGFLQDCLKKNPRADRIIVSAPFLKEKY